MKVRDADKRRAEALLAGIARRKVRISEDFYEIGLSLSELLKKKLYFALGHGSFEEMLKAHDVMSWSRAQKGTRRARGDPGGRSDLEFSARARSCLPRAIPQRERATVGHAAHFA